MNNLAKIKVGKILYYATFSISTLILYFQYRDINLANTYFIIGLNSVFIIILEYPTGVIGDYFSHLFSVKMGYLLFAISMILASLTGSYTYYVVSMFIGALGISLISGSIDALLYTYSDNYEKDYTQTQIQGVIFMVITSAIGGIVFYFAPNIPMLLTSLSYILGLLIFSSINEKAEKTTERFTGNIFEKAKEGIKVTFKVKKLFSLILFTGVFTAIFLNFKWLQNPIFTTLNIPAYYQGALFGVFSLISVIGLKIYQKSKGKSLNYAFILIPILTILIGVFINEYFVLILIGGLYLSSESGKALFNVELNKKIPDANRASILSLTSVITRGFYALITFIFGGLLSFIEFWQGVIILGIVCLIIVTLFLFQKSNLQEK